MAETWGAAMAWSAAITVGGAVLGGVAKQKEAKQAAANQKAAARDEAKYSGILSQFEKEQDEYYRQLGRQEKQRGLDEFKKFNSIGQFAPGYVGTNDRIVVPDKPSIESMLSPPASAEKKGSSILGKLVDPAKLLVDKDANKLGDPAGLLGG